MPLWLWRSLAVVRHELRVLRSDPVFVVVFTTMPLIVMAFVKPALGDLAGPSSDFNGAEQAVPGMTVLFALFLVGVVGLGFFREYGWRTWDRVRATGATPAQVVIGKVVVPFMQSAVQVAVLFGVGGLLYGLRVKGSVIALAATASMFSLSLICLGLALLALCKTILQLNAMSSLGAIVLAGVGGAITPSTTLPGWARTIAPATPSYWAMRGFRKVIIDGAGLGGAALSIAILALFSALFLLTAVSQFHYNDNKVSFA